MLTVATEEAKIYLGLKETATGSLCNPETVIRECQAYCDAVGLCVSITETRFIYTGGSEPGLVIGLIAYPRFPKTEIEGHAITLAKKLKLAARQLRVSIVTATWTWMLEEGDEYKDWNIQ